MVKAKTRFGELEVAEDKVIRFPEGILGFEESERFILVDEDPANPFKWLLSLDGSGLGFVVISPYEFMPGYQIELSRDDVDTLELAGPADAVVFAIVTVPEDPSKMTANLQAPLLINVAGRLGRQVVLGDQKYLARQSILEGLRAQRGAGGPHRPAEVAPNADDGGELFVAMAGEGR